MAWSNFGHPEDIGPDLKRYLDLRTVAADLEARAILKWEEATELGLKLLGDNLTCPETSAESSQLFFRLQGLYTDEDKDQYQKNREALRAMGFALGLRLEDEKFMVKRGLEQEEITRLNKELVTLGNKQFEVLHSNLVRSEVSITSIEKTQKF